MVSHIPMLRNWDMVDAYVNKDTMPQVPVKRFDAVYRYKAQENRYHDYRTDTEGTDLKP